MFSKHSAPAAFFRGVQKSIDPIEVVRSVAKSLGVFTSMRCRTYGKGGGALRIVAAMMTLAFVAGANPTRVLANPLPDHDYILHYVSPTGRELIIGQDGQEPAHYRLRDCRIGSSETGAFPILGQRDPAPLVAVLCKTGTGLRSLYVFAPAKDPTEPVYALEGKLTLAVQVTNTVGIQASWREPAAPDEIHSIIWEPNHGMVHSQRFSDAREPAFGKHIMEHGVLPDGLTPGDYVMARSPDTPLRLGPSEEAPWFHRAGNDLMIHLAGGDPHWHGADMWIIGDWLRLCPAEGGCGYVRAEAVVPLR